MPGHIDDQDDRGGAVQEPAKSERIPDAEDGLEDAQFVEHQGKPRHDEERERNDEEDVLDPLGQVHPQKNFIVTDECLRGYLFHRILMRRYRSAAMKARNTEINPPRTP